MCQMSVYLDDKKIAAHVTRVEPVGDGILIESLFELPSFVKGAIVSIDLLEFRLNLATQAKRQERVTSPTGPVK